MILLLDRNPSESSRFPSIESLGLPPRSVLLARVELPGGQELAMEWVARPIKTKSEPSNDHKSHSGDI